MAINFQQGLSQLLGLNQSQATPEHLLASAANLRDLAPGAAMLQSNQALQNSGSRQEQVKQIAPQISEALAAQDYNKAFSLFGSIDPEGASKMLAQVRGFNPEIAKKIKLAETEGGLEPLTAIGANQRQLLDRSIEAGKFDRQSSGLEDDRAFRRTERFQGDVAKVQDKITEATQLFDSAYAQAELAVGNANASRNLARSIIRAIEGPGSRVSNEDFRTAVGSAAVGDRFFNSLKSLADGRITFKTQKELLEMLDVSRKVITQKHQKVLDLRIKQASKRFGISEKEAREIALPGVEPPSNKVRMKTKSGKIVEIDKDSVKEAEKRGATLVQ